MIKLIYDKATWCNTCERIRNGDSNNCDGCKSSTNPEHYPPSKYIHHLLKEEKKMTVTIIGSLTTEEEMKDIKKYFEHLGFKVNCPGKDLDVQKQPLVDIYSAYIKKIEEADLIIAVPKKTAATADGGSEYIFQFGEATSYEIAIAKRFNKNIVLAW